MFPLSWLKINFLFEVFQKGPIQLNSNPGRIGLVESWWHFKGEWRERVSEQERYQGLEVVNSVSASSVDDWVCPLLKLCKNCHFASLLASCFSFFGHAGQSFQCHSLFGIWLKITIAMMKDSHMKVAWDPFALVTAESRPQLLLDLNCWQWGRPGHDDHDDDQHDGLKIIITFSTIGMMIITLVNQQWWWRFRESSELCVIIRLRIMMTRLRSRTISLILFAILLQLKSDSKLP